MKHRSPQTVPALSPEADGSVTTRGEAIGDRSKDEFLRNIYGRQRSLLRRLLSRRFFGSDNVEDIIQESYLRLFALDDPASLKFPRAFLFRTAVNLMLDQKRRENVRSAVIVPVRSDEEFERVIKNVPGTTATPEQIISDRQTAQILEDSINSLPVKCRTVFILHRMHCWPHKRIAERMGVSVQTVEKHMFRALKHCEAYLAKHGA